MRVPRVWAGGVARVVKEKAPSPGPRLWHLVDARAQVRRASRGAMPARPCARLTHERLRNRARAAQIVGRLAKNVAELLVGKHKPTHVPRLDGGDHVVVINAAEVEFTGRKWKQKMYYYHSGWMGNLKETVAKDLRRKFPERVLEYAVKGMLPKNKLRKQRMMRLHVFPGEEHTCEAELAESYTLFPNRWQLGVKPKEWYPKLELPAPRPGGAEKAGSS